MTEDDIGLAPGARPAWFRVAKRKLQGTRYFAIYHRSRRQARRIVEFLKHVLIRGAASSSFGSAAYYVLDPSFRRENQAVLQGRLQHRSSAPRGTSSSPGLRRNIHRLEKGLIMRPRRELFAADYIDDTVALYGRRVTGLDGGCEPDNELVWARDVLTAYFECCAAQPAVAHARAQFELIAGLTRSQGQSDVLPRALKVPYHSQERPESAITYDQFVRLAQRRRSVRFFADQPVEREKIDGMIEVARLAPSACNRQPFRFEILDDPKLARAAARLAGGTGGFAEQIPVLIIVVGDLSAYADERDRHLIYIDGALASMSLMLAAETLGLSTCPINWGDSDVRERKMRSFLGNPPKHLRPMMLIAVGYASEECSVPYSSKKELATLRRYNLEGR